MSGGFPGGFTAPVEDVQAAGAAAGRVADGAQAVDLVGPARAVGTALPGSASAVAGAAAAAAWNATMTRWGEQMRAQGVALVASAASYVEVDTAAAAGLPQMR